MKAINEMTKGQIIAELVANFEKGLKKTSKHYNQDLQDYKKFVASDSIKGLKEKLERSRVLNSKSFEKMVEKEVRKMDRAGMFNPSKMTAKYALS
jgi:hypothetical protein